MKNIRLAIIDNAMDHSVYTPVEHWRKHLPMEGETFRAPAGEFPDLQDGYTHLILTGSEASIVEREAWVNIEVDLVQRAASGGLAVLGSCWGHQLLALALSGPENVRRCSEPEGLHRTSAPRPNRAGRWARGHRRCSLRQARGARGHRGGGPRPRRALSRPLARVPGGRHDRARRGASGRRLRRRA